MAVDNAGFLSSPGWAFSRFGQRKSEIWILSTPFEQSNLQPHDYFTVSLRGRPTGYV